MTDENDVIRFDRAKPQPLEVFERDDREPIRIVASGFEGLMTFAETILLQEKYGVSVVFDEEKIEWIASDPQKRYYGTSNTPSGAVLMWDHHRKEGEGDEDV